MKTIAERFKAALEASGHEAAVYSEFLVGMLETVIADHEHDREENRGGTGGV